MYHLRPLWPGAHSAARVVLSISISEGSGIGVFAEQSVHDDLSVDHGLDFDQEPVRDRPSFSEDWREALVPSSHLFSVNNVAGPWRGD